MGTNDTQHNNQHVSILTLVPFLVGFCQFFPILALLSQTPNFIFRFGAAIIAELIVIQFTGFLLSFIFNLLLKSCCCGRGIGSHIILSLFGSLLSCGALWVLPFLWEKTLLFDKQRPITIYSVMLAASIGCALFQERIQPIVSLFAHTRKIFNIGTHMSFIVAGTLLLVQFTTQDLTSQRSLLSPKTYFFIVAGIQSAAFVSMLVLSIMSKFPRLYKEIEITEIIVSSRTLSKCKRDNEEFTHPALPIIKQLEHDIDHLITLEGHDIHLPDVQRDGVTPLREQRYDITSLQTDLVTLFELQCELRPQLVETDKQRHHAFELKKNAYDLSIYLPQFLDPIEIQQYKQQQLREQQRTDITTSTTIPGKRFNVFGKRHSAVQQQHHRPSLIPIFQDSNHPNITRPQSPSFTLTNGLPLISPGTLISTPATSTNAVTAKRYSTISVRSSHNPYDHPNQPSSLNNDYNIPPPKQLPPISTLTLPTPTINNSTLDTYDIDTLRPPQSVHQIRIQQFQQSSQSPQLPPLEQLQFQLYTQNDTSNANPSHISSLDTTTHPLPPPPPLPTVLKQQHDTNNDNNNHNNHNDHNTNDCLPNNSSINNSISSQTQQHQPDSQLPPSTPYILQQQQSSSPFLNPQQPQRGITPLRLPITPSNQFSYMITPLPTTQNSTHSNQPQSIIPLHNSGQFTIFTPHDTTSQPTQTPTTTALMNNSNPQNRFHRLSTTGNFNSLISSSSFVTLGPPPTPLFNSVQPLSAEAIEFLRQDEELKRWYDANKAMLTMPEIPDDDVVYNQSLYDEELYNSTNMFLNAMKTQIDDYKLQQQQQEPQQQQQQQEPQQQQLSSSHRTKFNPLIKEELTKHLANFTYTPTQQLYYPQPNYQFIFNSFPPYNTSSTLHKEKMFQHSQQDSLSGLFNPPIKLLFSKFFIVFFLHAISNCFYWSLLTILPYVFLGLTSQNHGPMMLVYSLACWMMVPPIIRLFCAFKFSPQSSRTHISLTLTFTICIIILIALLIILTIQSPYTLGYTQEYFGLFPLLLVVIIAAFSSYINSMLQYRWYFLLYKDSVLTDPIPNDITATNTSQQPIDNDEHEHRTTGISEEQLNVQHITCDEVKHQPPMKLQQEQLEQSEFYNNNSNNVFNNIDIHQNTNQHQCIELSSLIYDPTNPGKLPPPPPKRNAQSTLPSTTNNENNNTNNTPPQTVEPMLSLPTTNIANTTGEFTPPQSPTNPAQTRISTTKKAKKIADKIIQSTAPLVTSMINEIDSHTAGTATEENRMNQQAKLRHLLAQKTANKNNISYHQSVNETILSRMGQQRQNNNNSINPNYNTEQSAFNQLQQQQSVNCSSPNILSHNATNSVDSRETQPTSKTFRQRVKSKIFPFTQQHDININDPSRHQSPQQNDSELRQSLQLSSQHQPNVIDHFSPSNSPPVINTSMYNQNNNHTVGSLFAPPLFKPKVQKAHKQTCRHYSQQHQLEPRFLNENRSKNHSQLFFISSSSVLDSARLSTIHNLNQNTNNSISSTTTPNPNPTHLHNQIIPTIPLSTNSNSLERLQFDPSISNINHSPNSPQNNNNSNNSNNDNKNTIDDDDDPIGLTIRIIGGNSSQHIPQTQPSSPNHVDSTPSTPTAIFSQNNTLEHNMIHDQHDIVLGSNSDHIPHPLSQSSSTAYNSRASRVRNRSNSITPSTNRAPTLASNTEQSPTRYTSSNADGITHLSRRSSYRERLLSRSKSNHIHNAANDDDSSSSEEIICDDEVRAHRQSIIDLHDKNDMFVIHNNKHDEINTTTTKLTPKTKSSAYALSSMRKTFKQTLQPQQSIKKAHVLIPAPTDLQQSILRRNSIDHRTTLYQTSSMPSLSNLYSPKMTQSTLSGNGDNNDILTHGDDVNYNNNHDSNHSQINVEDDSNIFFDLSSSSLSDSISSLSECSCPEQQQSPPSIVQHLNYNLPHQNPSFGDNFIHTTSDPLQPQNDPHGVVYHQSIVSPEFLQQYNLPPLQSSQQHSQNQVFYDPTTNQFIFDVDVQPQYVELCHDENGHEYYQYYFNPLVSQNEHCIDINEPQEQPLNYQANHHIAKDIALLPIDISVEYANAAIVETKLIDISRQTSIVTGFIAAAAAFVAIVVFSVLNDPLVLYGI